MTVTYVATITLDDPDKDSLEEYLAGSIDHELWYIESKVMHIGPRNVTVRKAPANDTDEKKAEFLSELSKFYSSWFEGHTPTVEYLQILLNLNDQYFNDGEGLN